MDPDRFDAWLADYGKAWERKERGDFCGLFAEDARYYWTPVEEPKAGRRGIGAAFSEAVAGQDGIRFSWELLDVTGARGIAHWRCRFRRVCSGRDVLLDGMLVAVFDEDGLCTDFREWWHSDEHP